MRTFEVFASIDDNPAEKLGEIECHSPVIAIEELYKKVHDRPMLPFHVHYADAYNAVVYHGPWHYLAESR